MLRFCNRLVRFACSKQSQQSSSSYQISHSEKLRLLETVSQKVKLGLKPSILISEEESAKKRLSFEEKIQLGLYIPKSPFNPRLSRQVQQQYLPNITSELYQQQQENLTTFVRIMQDNLFLHSSEPTLDHYINVIYKDIYARYLLSKNVGIQWEGFYANTGVLNAKSTIQYDHNAKSQQNYSILLDFIQNNAHLIKQDETIGLFSYYQRKYINPSEVGVEKIKRMGHYIKEEMNSFGKYQHQFSALQQNNCKVYLLLTVERLEKLIKPNAICVNPDDRFMMLKRYQTEGEINIEYLIVSHHTYKQHQKYFKDNQYQKHNTFDGKYLLGMKCFNVPIVSEISGYQRPSNAYVVNSNCHIADFERVSHHNLPHFPPFISQAGEIQFHRSNNHIMLENKYMSKAERKENAGKKYAESYVVVDQALSFHMFDQLKLTKSLQKVFTEEGVKFVDFYDVIDDQLYFCEKTKEILHFRIGHKYVIDIPEENFQAIMKGFNRQQAVISESKIKIDPLNVGKRPKDKRKFRKEKKMKLSQVTDHFTLEESLADLTSMAISTLSQSQFVIPLFLKDKKIARYGGILDSDSIQALMKGQLKAINYQKIRQQGYEVKEIYANDQLLKALVYLRNLHKSKQIRNVVIEPQTETEALIPHAIHLNYLINKSKTRGRKLTQEVKNNIALIKLHPAMSQDFKDIKVRDLIEGVTKSNEKKQYGLGLQALRLWTASHDNYLGDRSINDEDINSELKQSSSIRTVFWNILSIMPAEVKEVQPTLYINKFMMDCIDGFIVNLEECYQSMNIHRAYHLISEFFDKVINEIYVKTIRQRVIAFPNLQENQEHFFVMRRILQLVSVVAPLFPFSAYHISRKAKLQWPEVRNPKFYEAILLHNEMIETRIKLVNKLKLNKLESAQIYCQSLKDSFSAHDLELFFNVKSVTFSQPDIEDRACSLPLSKNNSITSDDRLVIFFSQDSCIRCDHKSKKTDHLCRVCVQYLEEEIAQPLLYFPAGMPKLA